jgi:hypothetical protein
MINPIYSYIRAARELVSIRSGISHAKRASREKRAAAPNKRRKYERQENKIGVPSWWRETGRSTCERREVFTGAHPGNAAGTPFVSDYGPEVHRDRIPRHSKSSRQRSSRRVCLELTQLAPSWGLATSHLLRAASRKQQAASSKLQAFKFIVNRFEPQAASFKPQATSGKLQAARAFIKFFISVRVAGN